MRGGLLRSALLGTAAACLAGSALAAEAIDDLRQLSIEELADIQISSVSKKAEPLNAAPAAIYVITQDEILRSGMTTVPEMLRLAPNLEVARAGSSQYAISARGFNGTLANKLLVLIDGRSVYTPLYGGVYWDMQDVLRDDIDRIEVISGPGATLWGANAVNGVINIITRSSADTQGGVLTFGAGRQERSGSLRYGGKINDELTYRFYAKGFARHASVATNGAGAGDSWSIPQGGFRADWTRGADVVTLQGDFYQGSEEQPGIDQSVSGHNLLARWQHHMDDGAELQVQAYYDRARRFDTGGFTIDTYDLDVQHSFALGSWNNVVVGGGYRVMDDHLTNVSVFGILPAAETLSLGNIFVQDSISILDSLKLTVGVKAEDDPYSGLAVLPSGRLSWQIADGAMVWSAVSRAVRAPTRFDTGVFQKIGTLLFLRGDANFTSEKLTAYEMGTRIQPASNLSFSLSGFYNDYDDLRNVDGSPTPNRLPLFYANGMAGHVYGVEGWVNFQATDWWLLTAGFNVQHEKLHFKPGHDTFGGLQQAGNDPDHQVSLKSSMNITDDINFYADVRYIGALPNPVVPHYVELNSRVAWKASKAFEVSITGANLLHSNHLEFASSNRRIARSVFVEARWKF